MGKRLQKKFYERDAIDVARGLLGQRLVHRLGNGTCLSGRIVETEAYLGCEDPAAHSFGGRHTPRTAPMFGEPGLSYVYFIYGKHHCFNVVAAQLNVPEAVLVRALEPIEGFPFLCRDGEGHRREEHVANGPGKLCVAMGLSRAQNAIDMATSSELWIEEDLHIEENQIVEGARVGIGDRHDAVHWPLRFGLKGHPCLSPAKFTNYSD